MEVAELIQKLRVPYVDFPSQFETHRQEILKAVEQVLQRGDFILGQEVEEFEREFATLCGVSHAIGVASGTDALILALKALGIGPGDEVIVPPNTWISSVSAIVHVGARPVFADVRDDFNIDPKQVESKITQRTKAILPVHLTGRCADMEVICSIAKRHHLFVVEDAAQAVGARSRGKVAGSFGDLGCFSLHPLKNLNAIGDGGIITTNDSDLADRIRLFRNHGLKTRDEVVLWGFNSRLDTVQAAVLRVRLKHLPEVAEARRQNAKRYQEALSSLVTCPTDSPHEYAIYHLFMIQCEGRDALQEFLAKRGIEAKVHYPMPLHLQPVASPLGVRRGDLPVAEAQAKRILSLPVHSCLTRDQINWVVQSIHEFYGGRG